MTSFTVKAVCERYGVTPHTVLSWIRSGDLRAVNVGRSGKAKRPSWRITEAALETFEELRAPRPAARRRGTRARRRAREIVEFY
jgi:excisionase family DNA binding protein